MQTLVEVRGEGGGNMPTSFMDGPLVLLDLLSVA